MYNIAEYLEDKGIAYTQEGKNVTRGWINMSCVFCDEGSNHLGINPEHGGFNCWVCGERGSIVKLIAQIEHCDLQQAKKIAYKYYDGITTQKNSFIIPQKDITIPEDLSKEFSKIALDYLKKRNYSPEQIIKKYDIYWGGYGGFFKLRLVFPIVLNNEIVTYVGRDVTGKAHLKYKAYSQALSRRSVKETVFNLDTVSKKCILVEGVFDAIRIGDGCVAMLGKTYTKEQINLILSKDVENLYIMFDADATKDSYKLAREFSGYIKNVEVLELTHGDPGELSQQEVFNIRKDFLL